MADTVVSDAVAAPTDEGIASVTSGNEDWGSAGLQMLVGEAVHSDSYVRSGLGFSNHDGTNDTVDVDAGIAYLSLSGETVTVQSGKGGSNPPSYDTTLPDEPSICVILPSSTTVDLQASTLSQVWLAYDTDGTGPGTTGSVYLRSDDTGGVTAPSHPSVELGSANPDNASVDDEINREGVTGLIPSGVITMWSGSLATIPDGWALCDGTNGTPDLQDRFVVGAGGGSQYTVGDTGGEDQHTLTVAEMPSHTHTGGARPPGNTAQNTDGIDSVDGQQATGSTGGDSPHENRPPYYALAYIMKL